jgi:uncharacterized protein (TIGR02118 family)
VLTTVVWAATRDLGRQQPGWDRIPQLRRRAVIKAIILISRREGTSPEEFARHFNEQHRPLVAKLPGLRKLVVNHVLPNPNGPPPAYDAVAENWFDDPAAMAAAFAAPEGQAILADAENFLDLDVLQILVAEEEETPISA